MSMDIVRLPYENLARVEADDILAHLPSALGVLTVEQIAAIHELVADGYARGLEAAFVLSECTDDSPGDVMEAYAAGIEEGKREMRQGDK